MARTPLVVPFLALVTTLAAQDAVVDIADLLGPIREKYSMPALGAAVIVDGKLVALGASGIRRIGHADKVTADDLWHLGTCTKPMTATLCARFIEAGKLTWTTTVADAMPDLAPKMHFGARQITLQHLLTHRAGQPNEPRRELWLKMWDWKGTVQEARTANAAELLARAPGAALGERYGYSDAGYMIVGAMLERIGSASWEDLMRRELFTPLGITTGGFGAPGDDQSTKQPWGHVDGASGVEARFADNPPAVGPAGTVHMSLRDWAKFALLHLGVQPADKPVLKPETLQELRSQPFGDKKPGDYGLGWIVTKRPWAPGTILMHDGSNKMWFSIVWLAPDAKFGVLVTCNHGNGKNACDDVVAACIDRFRAAKK